MPTIIDRSIFVGELFIPNTETVPDIQSGNPSNQDKLTLAIEKYERLLLVNALGITQYNELISDIGAVNGKWYDLINGKTYDNKRFEGLKQIIAYYVYVNFLKYEGAQFTTVGLERSQAKNSVSVIPTDRLVDFWNTFVGMYQYTGDCTCFYLYPFVLSGNYNGSYVSLYQYLSDNSADYSTDYFRIYAIQNVLGI